MSEIQELSGKLTLVGKTKEQSGQYGDYKVQSCKIEKDGREVWVKVYGGGVSFQEKGKTVTFIPAGKGKIKFDEKYGYSVGEGCTIEHGGWNAPQSRQDSPKTSSKPSEGFQTQVEAVKEMADFMALCADTVNQFWPNLTPEERQSRVASLFIEGNKQGYSRLPKGSWQ